MLGKSIAALVVLALGTTTARADLWVGAEAPLAVAISDGQRGVFRPGMLPAGGVYTSRGAFALGLRMRAGFLRDGAPPAADREDPGVGGLFSTTLAARARIGGAWIEVAGGGAITGRTLAPTFELAAGVSFANESFELGPSARYVQVRSTDAMASFGTAELVLVGLDVRFGGRPHRPHAIAAARHRAPSAEPARVVIERDDERLVDLDASCVRDLAGCPLPDGMEVLSDRIILDERVLFDVDRARVRSRGRELVRAIVYLWQLDPGWAHITVEGHADVRGADAYNLALSELRAQRVRDLMIELGADASRLDAVGLGKARPRDPDLTEEAHQRNRRVEFVIERSAP